jgi:hypothetical protein
MLMSADSAAVRCRGVRGATFIEEDTPEAILAARRAGLYATRLLTIGRMGDAKSCSVDGRNVFADHDPTGPFRCQK